MARGGSTPTGGTKTGGSSGAAGTGAGGSSGGAAGGTSGTSTSSVVDECGVIEASGQAGPVKAVLKASRKCGYPPLAVHFDATGSTSTNSSMEKGGDFHQIKHAFNFGDPKSGTHALSGLSKNEEAAGGGLAAHVYDNPGTYTVTLESTDSSGSKTSTSLQLTVLDPSGLATYAISKAGDFADAPAGAKQLTALPKFESNSRYFFRSGENWSGSEIRIQDPLANIQIDAYGSGAKPIFDIVNVGAFRPATNNFVRDIRVCNVHATNGFHQETGSRVLFYRCEADGSSGTGISWAPVDQYRVVPQEQFENAHELFFVDCRLDGHGTQGGYIWYGNGSRLVFLNTFMGGIQKGTVRIVSWDRGVMRHCQVESPYEDASVHALKVHSGGPNQYDDNWYVSTGGGSWDLGGSWKTSKIVIADNKFGGGKMNVNWTVAVCPSNNSFAEFELMEDVIIEKNKLVHLPGWAGLDIAYSVYRLSIRGNTAVWEGGGSGDASVQLGVGHDLDWKNYTKPLFIEQ
jgi:hypothetical protein